MLENLILQSTTGHVLTAEEEDHLVNDLADLDLQNNLATDTYQDAEGAVDDVINQFLDEMPPEIDHEDRIEQKYVDAATSRTEAFLKSAEAGLQKMDSFDTPKAIKPTQLDTEEHVPPTVRRSSTQYVPLEDAGSPAAAARAREEILRKRKQSNSTVTHGADSTIHKVVTRRESVAMQSDLFTLLNKDEKKMQALLKRTRDFMRGNVDGSLYYFLCGKLFGRKLAKAIPKIMLIVSNKRKQAEFRACHLYTVARKCPHCSKNVFQQEEAKVPPYSFHKWCLKCTACSNSILQEGDACLKQGKVVHKACKS